MEERGKTLEVDKVNTPLKNITFITPCGRFGWDERKMASLPKNKKNLRYRGKRCQRNV